MPIAVQRRSAGRDRGPDDHDAVRRGQHRDRSEPVGEPAAHRTHDHGDHDETGHPVGGVGGREPVGGLQVGGQVDRERDVAAEGDGVEDAGLPGDRQPRVGDQPAGQARGGDAPAGGVAQEQPGHDGVDRQRAGGDQERGLRAHVGEQLHRGERADRGPAHAGPEDADRQAAPLGREPGVDERHADGERGAGDAEEEAPDQDQCVGVQREEGQEQDRHDRHRRDQREHDPAAVAVGQRPDQDAAQGSDQDRHGDQEGHVGLAEGAQGALLAEQRAERAEQRPRPEVHGEPERRQRQHQVRRSGPGVHLGRCRPGCHRHGHECPLRVGARKGRVPTAPRHARASGPGITRRGPRRQVAARWSRGACG